jgi:hypothetical protein
VSANAPVVIASGIYHDGIFHLELFEREPPVFAVRCPVCHVAYRLNPLVFQSIRVDLVTKEFTVRGTIYCPTPLCGWSVTITKGIARDVDPPQPTTNTGVRLITCWNCGRSCCESKKRLCGYCEVVIGKEFGVGGNGGFKRQAQPVRRKRGRKILGRLPRPTAPTGNWRGGR